MADAIHMTNGASNILVQGNRIEYAGDDSIAVVNYGGSKPSNINIQNNIVVNNRWGRGITAVGSNAVNIVNNLVSGNLTGGAGIYIASEPAYNTPAPFNVLVKGNTIQDTGGPIKGHGQIMLWSGAGPIHDVTIEDNNIQGSKRADLAFVLSGSMNNINLTNNRVDGQISFRNNDSRVAIMNGNVQNTGAGMQGIPGAATFETTGGGNTALGFGGWIDPRASGGSTNPCNPAIPSGD